MLSGGISFITLYIFYQDLYLCPFPGSNCLDYVCSFTPDQRIVHIPDQPMIYSLANKFGDNPCKGEIDVLTLIKTLMYGGTLLGT